MGITPIAPTMWKVPTPHPHLHEFCEHMPMAQKRCLPEREIGEISRSSRSSKIFLLVVAKFGASKRSVNCYLVTDVVVSFFTLRENLNIIL